MAKIAKALNVNIEDLLNNYGYCKKCWGGKLQVIKLVNNY